MVTLGGNREDISGRGGSRQDPEGWPELDWITGWGWQALRLGDSSDGDQAGECVFLVVERIEEV